MFPHVQVIVIPWEPSGWAEEVNQPQAQADLSDLILVKVHKPLSYAISPVRV